MMFGKEVTLLSGVCAMLTEYAVFLQVNSSHIGYAVQWIPSENLPNQAHQKKRLQIKPISNGHWKTLKNGPQAALQKPARYRTRDALRSAATIS